MVTAMGLISKQDFSSEAAQPRASNIVLVSRLPISLNTFFFFLFIALILVAFLVAVFGYAPPVYRPDLPPTPPDREPLLPTDTSNSQNEPR